MRVNRKFIAVLVLGGLAAAANAGSVAVNAASTTYNGESAPYAWVALGSTQSRADVQAKAVAVAAGQSTRRDADLGPADNFVSTKTRAEVRAEAIAALRLGLVSQGEFSTREATPAELELIRMAGARARAANGLVAGK
jgi:hypothetical protein